MSQPSGCTVCHADALMWWHGEPVGPGRRTQASASPMCVWHDKARQMENGGLARAEVQSRPLDQLLLAFDKADERQSLRLRGVGAR